MDRLAFNAAAAIDGMRTGRQMTTNELAANVATPGFKRKLRVGHDDLESSGWWF
jgi:flagellar basal body rod protein FlgF